MISPSPRNKYYPYNSHVAVRIQTDEAIEELGYTILAKGDGASSVRPYLAMGAVCTQHS